MRIHLRKKLAELLAVAVFMSLFSVNAMAGTVLRIDMGTFFISAEAGDPGGGEDPGGNDPGNDHPRQA